MLSLLGNNVSLLERASGFYLFSPANKCTYRKIYLTSLAFLQYKLCMYSERSNHKKSELENTIFY